MWWVQVKQNYQKISASKNGVTETLIPHANNTHVHMKRPSAVQSISKHTLAESAAASSSAAQEWYAQITNDATGAVDTAAAPLVPCFGLSICC